MRSNDLPSRRSVLLGATSIVLASPLAGCAETTLGSIPKDAPTPADDVRLRALSFAVLAPNAHNTQPWRVDLRRPGELDLLVDRARLLPETDPPARQIHMSHGTFLELLDIAAREHGHALDLTYFPAGEYGPEEIADRPVATARFTPRRDAPKDPLFSQITRRLTNRRIYEAGRALTEAQIDGLQRAAGAEHATFRVIHAPAIRSAIAGLLGEAMAAESAAPARNLETARWYHFGDAADEKRRDGFGLAHAGHAGASRWFLETFVLSRASAADPRSSFASGAVTQAREQAASAAAFGLLTTRANTRRAQVLAGRAYARVALTASALGVAVHPMSQITEEYADMRPLTRRFREAAGVAPEETVQLVVRLGFAAPHAHPPRRDPRALAVRG